MVREIIEINEEKCDGCGQCIPSCKEGALKVIDGKCRLVSEVFCDGLGACLGDCPQDALKVVKKDVSDYDEIAVLESMLSNSDNWVIEHLVHLHTHNATDYLESAKNHLIKINRSDILDSVDTHILNIDKNDSPSSCPSTQIIELKTFTQPKKNFDSDNTTSQLAQWPIQLHLVNPLAPYFKGKELLIMSTCAPLAYPNIQEDYLKGRSLVVACPKLDNTDPYSQKLAEIFVAGEVKKVRIVRMEVPCCGGLINFAGQALQMSGVQMELIEDIIGIDGTLKSTKVLFSNIQNAV